MGLDSIDFPEDSGHVPAGLVIPDQKNHVQGNSSPAGL